ncbi:MAG TPA: ABC transporter substrate-binding protein [Jatrophihabitans sp.]|nr:ABC transporter substrate-binding protein [Jatrophihabitans sp.]
MFETITRRSLRRGALAGIAVAAAGAVLAACSSSGGGSSNNSTPAAGGTGASSSGAAASTGLMQPGVLTVGMNLQFKPEMYLDNGKPAGYDVDLLNKLAASMGVKLNIQNLDFNGLIPGLQAKKFDLVSVGLTPNADREKVVDFTRSYVPYASILAVKASDNSPASISTYNKSGVTITALQGSSDETLAKASFPKAKVEGLSDQSATLLEVQTGRAQGAVLEDYILAQYVKANPGQLKQAQLAKPLSLSYGSWAVQKGDTALTNALNAFLCKAQSDGTLAQLYKQDFGATMPTMPAGC